MSTRSSTLPIATGDGPLVETLMPYMSPNPGYIGSINFLIMTALFVPTAAIAGPCTADKLKFCKDVQATDVGACLAQHKDELSEACKAKQAKGDTEGQAPAEKKQP